MEATQPSTGWMKGHTECAASIRGSATELMRAVTRMDFADGPLSEISQSQKAKSRLVPPTPGPRRTQTHGDGKRLGRGEGGRRRGKGWGAGGPRGREEALERRRMGVRLHHSGDMCHSTALYN